MGWPLVLGLIMVCLGRVIVGLSNAVFYKIVREVNAASPEHRPMSFWKARIQVAAAFSSGTESFFQIAANAPDELAQCSARQCFRGDDGCNVAGKRRPEQELRLQ
jgi:hypothetical protein